MVETVIVGDVHGCLDELRDLLREVGHGPGVRLVLAGDAVAKGPDSQGVVQLARELGALCVLGNHDAHVLEVRRVGGGKPEHEQVARALTPADWRWLEALPLVLPFDDQGVVVAHGGLLPGVPFEQQQRDVVINLRSFDAEGRPSRRVEGTPWAARWPGPLHAVFGHDAVRGLQQHPHATGLDTGCVYGRRLTALTLPERRLVWVPARRAWSPWDPSRPQNA